MTNTLPDLTIGPRMLGFANTQRLSDTYASALESHYMRRGCIVVDLDKHADPLAAAMPLLTNTTVWHNVRLELLRHLLLQVSSLTSPVVFFNIRMGNESQCFKDLLPGIVLKTFYVITNAEEALPVQKIPILDLTQIYPHVLDSLF